MRHLFVQRQPSEREAVQLLQPKVWLVIVENSYPAVAQWVQGCGWIGTGDQEGLGFTVRALDCGGVVFEDTECRSLTEAMASLESGLAVAMKELGIN